MIFGKENVTQTVFLQISWPARGQVSNTPDLIINHVPKALSQVNDSLRCVECEIAEDLQEQVTTAGQSVLSL